MKEGMKEGQGKKAREERSGKKGRKEWSEGGRKGGMKE